MSAAKDIVTAVNAPGDNPFELLLAQMPNPADVGAAYEKHRTTRIDNSRAFLTSPAFQKLWTDPHLSSLLNSPDYVDPRNSTVIWSHPPSRIKDMAGLIMDKVRTAGLEGLWFIPTEHMHITVLEIAHSLPYEQISAIVDRFPQDLVKTATDYTLTHRTTLLKPKLTYDEGALTLTFLPAVEDYTYLHLRRDLLNLFRAAGVKLESRYAMPSAHLTIGRFVTPAEKNLPSAMKKWVELLDEINDWLEADYWPKEGQEAKKDGHWQPGEGMGLHLVKGRVWYGTGETVRLGEGF